MKHGITGYTDYRCRCDVCRSAAKHILLTAAAERRKEGQP